VALWIYARDIQARWTNVPPVPSSFGVSGFGLGDTQFAYRSLGLMIQNLGDTGGRTTNFEEYDYTALGEWFRLMDTLDASANFIPFLAAYYFGSVETPAKAAVIVDYLAEQGRKAGSQKWRWLARASFLARFAEKNQDKALTLARELAAMYPKVQLPFWARQMPVFILEERGQKEAALAMVLETLKSESHTLPPQEVNALIDVICTRLLSKEEVQTFPLCEDYRNP
jgi:hypothetical protein